MSRANQWFVPGNDIAREVITADIQRYLGPDALVRPGVGTGDYQGQQGYWITAYRTLTSQMIQDLRSDSLRWQAERQPEAGRGGGVAYQDSQTHAARQHWGPTTPYDPQPQASRAAYDERRDSKQPQRQAYSSNSGYGQPTSDHYTTSPTPYQSGYTASSAAPRTQPTDQYYQPQPPAAGSGYQPHQQYSSQPDAYNNRTTPVSTSGYPPQSTTAQPGFYIASDGRQYPLSQQPQTNPQQQSSNPQRTTRYPGQGR